MLERNLAPPSFMLRRPTLITGLAYPLAMTGIAQAVLSRRRPTAAWSSATARWSARR